MNIYKYKVNKYVIKQA